MEIEYENIKVKTLFEDFQLMSKKNGKDFTKLVKKRYDQLKAAETFTDYLSTGLGKPYLLKGNKSGLFAITITKNSRLIVKPITKDLSIESLKECKKILIMGAEDYHGTKSTKYIP